MASKVDLARQYLALQQERKVDDLLALLADDVALTVPMLGTVEGKSAVEERLRALPAGGRGGGVSWSEPEEEGDQVRIAGSGGPLGQMQLTLSFNPEGLISKIEIGAVQRANGQQGLPFQPPPLDMSWAKVPTERPPKPAFGPEGFTLRMADAGSYGYVPDRWLYENDTPRGAWAASGERRGLPAPYTIYDKYEVWAESAADLYELAIQQRWVPATQVSWSTIEPLPEHIEAALDQIYTSISEQQYNSMQALSGWLEQISYGFHEVKLYLATQIFDQARHVEAFRKRALFNGGGLGVQQPGFLHRAVHAAFKFTELVIYINILRGSFTLALCEWGDRLGRSQADRELFEHMARDLRRHLAYGIEHLKYYLRTDQRRIHNIHSWLNRGEVMLAVDLRRDKPLREAFILALGDTVQEGKAGLKELRQAQLQQYLQTLEAATVYGRGERLVPTLQEAIENP